MSSRYSVCFTKYSPIHSRRTITPDNHYDWHCEDFCQAYEKANDVLAGMRAADPESLYEIVSIECTSYFSKPGNPMVVDYDDPFNTRRKTDKDTE